jgi:hypothetical protein
MAKFESEPAGVDKKRPLADLGNIPIAGLAS